MRRVLLVGLLLVALALGVGGGYLTGDYLDSPGPTASGTAGPIGNLAPTPAPSPTPSLPVKTPVPNNTDPLETGLNYSDHTFTVNPPGAQPVQLSIRTPRGWRLTRDDKKPGEVKFYDKLNQRWIRVAAVEPAVQTPAAAMSQLIIDLRKSQPPENNVQVLGQTSGQVEGDDGSPRTYSTLTYSYIPSSTLLNVIVRWIAIDGTQTNINMSVTGLPQDAPALKEVLEAATTSVRQGS
ncbi:hypothetical protein PWY87_33745 [Kribbella solani]|uniref:hypothetical protein n=1 Tax=Kribbella solani TaxID=236067 RepID=UPI0029BAE6DE|nr:hypothetical protein [Kribbella solani]MDX3006688.1 hypothetical protein [Kribbella solani]